MAIETNLIFQLFPAAGDTLPVNIVDAATMTFATGTPTLVDVGVDKAWNLTGGQRAELSVPDHLLASNVAGSGVTIAVRFNIDVKGANNFDEIVGFSTYFLAKNGNTKVSSKVGNQGNVSSQGSTISDSTLTFVIRVDATSGVEVNNMWWNKVGRVGNAPDSISNGFNLNSTQTLNQIFMQALGTMNTRILDYAVWDAELTDAECASIADDYRAVMPGAGSSTTPVEFAGTVPTQNGTENEAFSVDLASYFSGTETPFTYSIQSGTLQTGLSLTGSVISGTPTATGTQSIVVRATDQDTDTDDTNSFDIVIAAEVVDPIINTLPLKNNTGTLLANETGVTVDIYNPTTGALVLHETGETTNASGICSIQDDALSAATEYRVVVKLDDDSEGVARITTV